MNETFENEQYTRRMISKLAFGMLAGALMIQVAAVVLNLVLPMFNGLLLMDTNSDIILSAVCVYCVGLPLAYLILKDMRHVHPHKNKIGVGQFFKLFAVSYALAYVSNILGTVVITILSVIKGAPIENNVFDAVMNTDIVTELIFMVILAPVVEELVFRKLIIDRTLILGDRTAIFISALCFGLFHGNLSQFIYAFMLGMIFGYIYIRTGNILITIGLHGMMNLLGSVVASSLLKMIDLEKFLDIYESGDINELLMFFADNSAGMIIFSIYGTLIFAVVILGLVFFFMNVRRLTLYEGEIVIPRESFFKTTLSNPGMIFFIVFFIILMILQIIK
ncbi:MAG: CPBP family intramembrane metalloprotease [Lachnospiraceae bacterium]|nr:CPBP family intramembrane metalloprotease [Lachnospiraceae bacterium]